VPDKKLRKLRKLIDQQSPQGSAHMSDADVAGLAQLLELAGNPTAAASLIEEIDGWLNADSPEHDAFLIGGGIGARFDTPEQARSYLKQLKALFTGESVPRKEKGRTRRSTER
jgi:hypothetical protein